MRTGKRYAPRVSITITNVFPDASCTAVMVTPGSTPPVLSVAVPLTTASCANPLTGSASAAPSTSSHATTRITRNMGPPCNLRNYRSKEPSAAAGDAALAHAGASDTCTGADDRRQMCDRNAERMRRGVSRRCELHTHIARLLGDANARCSVTAGKLAGIVDTRFRRSQGTNASGNHVV